MKKTTMMMAVAALAAVPFGVMAQEPVIWIPKPALGCVTSDLLIRGFVARRDGDNAVVGTLVRSGLCVWVTGKVDYDRVDSSDLYIKGTVRGVVQDLYIWRPDVRGVAELEAYRKQEAEVNRQKKYEACRGPNPSPFLECEKLMRELRDWESEHPGGASRESRATVEACRRDPFHTAGCDRDAPHGNETVEQARTGRARELADWEAKCSGHQALTANDGRCP
jgi:hypothetical protein